MDLQVLAAELTDDPLSVGYALMSDAQAADALNTPSRPGKKPVDSTDVRMFVLLNGLWPALADLAQNSANPLYKATAVTILQTIAAGAFDQIRMNRPEVHAGVSTMLQTMVDAGVMTAEQRAALIAMGDATISRAEELGLGQVHHLQVAEARNG